MTNTDKTAVILTGVGALNWGLVALLDFDLVEIIFGVWPTVAKIVYLLIGVAGIYILANVTKFKKSG